MKNQCSVTSCEKPRIARGLCSMHNWRFQKYGSIDGRQTDCRECGTKFYASKMQKHYCSAECAQKRADGTLCRVAGCAGRSYGSVHCPKHQYRKRNWGRVEDNPQTPCAICNEMFTPRMSAAKYCSKKCLRESRAEYTAAYFSDPKVKAERAQYNRKRADHNKTVSRAWYLSNRNPFRDFTSNHRRRAQSYIDFPESHFDARMAYFGYKCWMCRGQFEAVDHVKPVSRGGPHMLSNLRPICRSCNGRKHNDWPLSQMWARLNADTLFNVSEVIQ